MEKITEYEQFKKLLEYFVAHLQFCVSNQKKGEAYETYIKEIKDFKRSGQGQKGHGIQNQIKDWESYENGKICVNVNATTYKGKGTYLNWIYTSINVNTEWKDNKIINLNIMENSYPLKNAKHVMTSSVSDLGLFDKQKPNDKLKVFFNQFNGLIIHWNNEQKNKNEMKHIEPYVELLKTNKNIILTGAPGTGKTYLAKQIAKQMIGVKTDEELEKSKQFGFVQFHPSYDYTDFVEGLRPTPPNEDGTIGFELRPGIFKSFCNNASGINAIEHGGINNFTIEKFEEYLRSTNMLNDTTINRYVNNIKKMLGEVETEQEIPRFESLEKLCENHDAVKDFDNEHDLHSNYLSPVSKLIEFKNNLATYKDATKELKPFIFIIDEINRGEISKIFGELFFSIDPSYRGKKGAVKTQYSNLHENEKEVFYVPENVYIIGSMNDIDRSVESFDFAMRRRFTWIEITSEQSAENMNLPQDIKERMLRLNEQITNTDGLNPAYHIGAAYFLDSDGNVREDVGNIWNLRIEPLLKEYLRGVPDSKDKLQELKNAFFNENN